jgi:Zn-dependent M16 (insulinase) family peptidase
MLMKPHRRSETHGGRRQAVGEASVNQRVQRLVSQPPLPTPRTEREHQLEKQIQELKQQLHEQEVENLLDLRQALGLVGEKERSKSAENLSRIPTTALRLLKTDLVKILAKVNSLTLPSPISTEIVRGDECYIA